MRRVKYKTQAAMCVLPDDPQPWWIIQTGAVWWKFRVKWVGIEEEWVGIAVPATALRKALLVVHYAKEVRCYDPPMLKTYTSKIGKTMYAATAMTREHSDGRVFLEWVHIIGDHFWRDSYDATVWSTRAHHALDPAAATTIVNATDTDGIGVSMLFPELDLDSEWCGVGVEHPRWKFDFYLDVERHALPETRLPTKKRRVPE